MTASGKVDNRGARFGPTQAENGTAIGLQEDFLAKPGRLSGGSTAGEEMVSVHEWQKGSASLQQLLIRWRSFLNGVN